MSPLRRPDNWRGPGHIDAPPAPFCAGPDGVYEVSDYPELAQPRADYAESDAIPVLKVCSRYR